MISTKLISMCITTDEEWFLFPQRIKKLQSGWISTKVALQQTEVISVMSVVILYLSVS